MTKLLSIIIPMYNVAPYLERCIRSLQDQDIGSDNFEIICINDGSPDNSRDIVLRLRTEFANIVLIDQENQGVSRARNNGINSALGTYLLFVDPDDYVESHSFGRVLSIAKSKDAQVFFLGFSFLTETGAIRSTTIYSGYTNKIVKGTDAYSISRGNGLIDPDRMWAILFNRHFFDRNGLRFLPDVPYLEDGEFIARILCLADRCIFDDLLFYIRTTRRGSATNSNLFHSEKARKGFLLGVANLKQFQAEKGLDGIQREFMNQPILKFVLLVVTSSNSMGNLSILAESIKSLNRLSVKRVDLKGCNKLYRFYGNAYNASPWLAAFLLTVFPKVRYYYFNWKSQLRSLIGIK